MQSQALSVTQGSRARTALGFRPLKVSARSAYLWSLLLCFAAGCNTSPESTPPPVEETPPPPPPFKLSGHLDDLKTPADLMFVGGFNVLEQTAERLARDLPNILLSSFDLKEQWLNQYVQTELMIEPAFIHMGRPLRAMRFSIGESSGFVHLIGVNDRDAFLKSSSRFETLKHQGAELYVYKRYKGDKNPLHFMFMRHNMVAVTRQLELLSASHLSFYDKLSHVSVSGLMSARVFPSQLQLDQGELKRTEDELNGLALKGSSASVARQKGLLRAALHWAYQVARDSRRVEVILNLDQARVTLDVDWKLDEASTTFAQTRLLSGGDHPLAQELSAAALLISAQMPKSLLSALTREWNRYILNPPQPMESAVKSKVEQRSSKRVSKKKKRAKKKRKREKRPKSLPAHLGVSPEAVADYLHHISRATQSLSGELALAAVLQPSPLASGDAKGGEPASPDGSAADKTAEVFLPSTSKTSLRWVGLFRHTDQKSLQESLETTLSIYQDKEVKAALRKRGLRVSIKKKMSTDPEGEVISIKSRMPRTPRFLRPLRPQLKELYSAHLWVGADRGVVGFANSWGETLRAHAQPPSAQEVAYPAEALKAGVESPLLFIYLNPVTLISALKRGRAGSILLPLQMMFASASNTEGLGLTVGRNPQGVSARLTVARSLLESIRSSMSGVPTGSSATVTATPKATGSKVKPQEPPSAP